MSNIQFATRGRRPRRNTCALRRPARRDRTEVALDAARARLCRAGGDRDYAGARRAFAAFFARGLAKHAPREEACWRKWITEGRQGSLMPAFAKVQRGPLTEAQIDSLIEYALNKLPTQPRPR